MKSFIAALLAAITAADSHSNTDWEPAAACYTTLDEQARWLQPRASAGAYAPADFADWDQATKDSYQSKLDAIAAIASPAPLDDAARDGAEELIFTVEWNKSNGDQVTISEENGWPTYPGDEDADCVEPAITNAGDNYNLANHKSVVAGATLQDANGAAVLEVTAVTGWVKHGGGDDAGIGYQIAADITSKTSWNGTGTNAVALVFGNDNTVDKLEYNEFNVINFAVASFAGISYNKQNVAGTALPDVTGYAPLTDNKPYNVSWRESNGNWTPGAPFIATFGQNVNTPGFWKLVRSNTWMASGQEAADNSRFIITVEKESLGEVTTNIKAGGKIHGVVGYKNDNTQTAFTAKSGVTPFEWAAEPEKPDDNTTDGGDGGDENEDDSATSMVVYGASFLAAISALAF